jgi:hypothetical protein
MSYTFQKSGLSVGCDLLLFFEYTVTSSKYTATDLLISPRNVTSMALWKVSLALINPKGMRL